jgi:arsenite/tail-anchored protein-transporting ATPase
MTERVVLVVGKGGVGKTTFSAATAVTAAARQDGRVLVASTDAAHSLADALGQAVGSEPRPVAPNLDAVQLDGRHELERSWGMIADYLADLFGVAQLDRLHAEELLVLPGLDQLLALVRLRTFLTEGAWRFLVVDCAPSADSLRLLSLPEVLDWYLVRLFGKTGVIGSRIRRHVERTLSVNAPDERVLESVSHLTSELSDLRSTLQRSITTARIVTTPEHLVVAEAQRTLSYLALYDYAVDAVLVNRVLGDRVTDPLLEQWRANQLVQLKEIDSAFSPLPQLRVHLRPSEPIGIDALADVGAELYRDTDPMARLSDRAAVAFGADGDRTVIRIPVAGVDRDDIDVERGEGELAVSLGAYRRVITLPDSLRYRPVVRAGIRDEMLEVVFGSPDD